MSDFQLSMFKSQISSQDAPQDHAIFASLYNYAVKHHIKYILTGSNNSTEFIRPPVEWIYMNDLRMYKDIHKKFGKREMKTYPTCGILRYRILYKYFFGMKRFFPLIMLYTIRQKQKSFYMKNTAGLNMLISIMKMCLQGFLRGIIFRQSLDLIREKMYIPHRFLLVQ